MKFIKFYESTGGINGTERRVSYVETECNIEYGKYKDKEDLISFAENEIGTIITREHGMWKERYLFIKSTHNTDAIIYWKKYFISELIQLYKKDYDWLRYELNTKGRHIEDLMFLGDYL